MEIGNKYTLFWQLEISNISKLHPPRKAVGHYSEAKRYQILLKPTALPQCPDGSKVLKSSLGKLASLSAALAKFSPLYTLS